MTAAPWQLKAAWQLFQVMQAALGHVALIAFAAGTAVGLAIGAAAGWAP